VRALLRLLFNRSAWDKPAYVLAGKTFEGAVLVFVLSVSVGSASPCSDGTTSEGAS
jgi:hypothetical protein